MTQMAVYLSAMIRILLLLAAGCGPVAEVAQRRAPTDDNSGSQDPIEDSTCTQVPAVPDCNFTASAPESCADDGVVLKKVCGAVADTDGCAVENAFVVLCVRSAANGEVLCHAPVRSGAQGLFQVSIDPRFQCAEHAALRILEVPAPGVKARLSAATYCELPLSAAGKDLAIDTPYRVFAMTPATSLPAQGSPRTVAFADGLELTMEADDTLFGTGGVPYTDMTYTKVDPAQQCFLDQPSEWKAIYAFQPEGEPRDPWGFSIPTDLAAGTAVELWLLGGLACTLADQTHVLEGEWAKFAETTVAEDLKIRGKTPCVGWLGYRVAPTN
jgi:hypothetical protein